MRILLNKTRFIWSFYFLINLYLCKVFLNEEIDLNQIFIFEFSSLRLLMLNFMKQKLHSSNFWLNLKYQLNRKYTQWWRLHFYVLVIVDSDI